LYKIKKKNGAAVEIIKKDITSSVYDCTVEDVEYSRHLVVVITS